MIAVKIGTSGIGVPGEVQETLDIRFDGRRVFSASPEGSGGPWKVDWPKRLTPYLDGRTTVGVVTHLDGTPLGEAELRFGTSTERIDVVDERGRPLSVDKFGHLVRMFDSLTPATAADIVAKGDQIARDIGEFGVAAWVTGGALLGALRTGHMIGHDMDIDVTYVSDFEDPADFTLENYELERFLIAKGWHMTRIRVGLMRAQFTDLDGDERHIDVFVGHFRDGSYHSDRFIDADFPRSDLVPLATVTLEGQQVLAPAHPESLMEASYGPTWRIPDPSFAFTFTEERLRKSQAWYGVFPQYRNAWERQLTAQWKANGFGEQSDFATWVLAHSDAALPIVDLGSGVGCDTMAYARAGRAATASDYVLFRLRRLRKLAAQEGLEVSTQRFNFYDLRPCLLATASLRARFGGPAVVASRGTLDVLESEGQLTFWTVARGLCRDGGRLLLEFATAPERHRRGDPGFRALQADVVTAQAERRGGKIVQSHDLGSTTRLIVDF